MMCLSRFDSITVVIPLFNKGSTVSRAINSVIEQLDYGDRLVVIDDGSTDGGVDPRVLIHERIRVIRQENLGVSSARNRGFLSAETSFVAFLDADDYWFPGALAEFKRMISFAPDCVLYSFQHVRWNGSGVAPSVGGTPLSPMERLAGADFITRYASEQLVNSSTVCVRREVLQRIGGFPVGVCSGEDVYTWIRLSQLGDVCVSPNVLSVIERPAPGQRLPRLDMPFYLEYFSRRAVLNEMPPDVSRAIRIFLCRRGLSQAAGRVLEGRRALGAEVLKLVWAVDKLVAMRSFLVLLAPRFLLNALYEVRQLRARKSGE